MAVALVLAGLMNFITYWFSDKIVLAMYGAREVARGDAPVLWGENRQQACPLPLMPMPRVT